MQPLDPQQGTGEIQAVATFSAYADDLRAWQQRVTGTDPQDSHWYYFDVAVAPIPAPNPTIIATLVFERHESNTAAAFVALNDIDLRLHDPTGNAVAVSNSLVDSVEHIVHTTNAAGRYCLEVDPFNLSMSNPGMVTPELYGVAANHRLVFNGTVNPCVPDLGDAPDPPYGTLVAHAGARHLDWTKEWLGTSRAEIDGELRKVPLGQVVSRVEPYPSVSGERDANDAADQDGKPNLVDADGFDDGVALPSFFVPFLPSPIKATVQATIDKTGFGPTGRYDKTNDAKRLYLSGWADWDGDGSFENVPQDELIGIDGQTGIYRIDPQDFGAQNPPRFTIGETFVDMPPAGNGSGMWEPGESFTEVAGVTEKTFTIPILPPLHFPERVWFRFRLSYGGDAAVIGGGSLGDLPFGEVEDYVRCSWIGRISGRIKDGARVLRGVVIGISDALGRLSVGQNTAWDDGTWALGEQLQVGNGSSLWGVAATTHAFGRGAAARGPIEPMPAVPLLDPFPSPPAVTCGTIPVVVAPGQTVALAPGSYGVVRVRDGGTLTLAPGIYHLCSLVTGRNAKVLVGSGSRTTVNVKSVLRLGPGGVLQAPSDTAPPIMNVEGRRVVLGHDGLVEAMINAPAAKLRLGRALTYYGSFLVRNFLSDHSVTCGCVPP